MARRAAVYIRMSTEDQQNSPERQLTQISAYCQTKGYTVIDRYEDLALRGHDDTRPQFERLIRDAKAGRFDVVVVDEPSRLTRNDPLDYFARVAHPLREAGVSLDTVSRGLRDWSDLGGLIMQTVDQHAAHGEVVTLSRRVVGQLAERAVRGQAIAGKPPYGYEVVWVNEEGEVVHRGKRNWTKARTDVTPKLSVVPAEAEVVRSIFRAYAEQDASLAGIVKDLQRRAVPSPLGGDFWSRGHVRNLLTNRAYVGDYIFNRESAGTCHGLSLNKLGDRTVGIPKPRPNKPAPGRKTRVTPNAVSDWVVIQDHHKAIVPRGLFEKTAGLLERNRDRSTPKPSRGDYVLSKLFKCQRCGSWFVGDYDSAPARRGTGEPYRYYICGGYSAKGPAFCRPYRVVEGPMLSLVLRVLRERLLTERRMGELLARAQARRKEAPAARERKSLEASARRLDMEVERGTAILGRLDGAILDRFVAQLRLKQARLDEARDALKALPAGRQSVSAESLVVAAKGLRDSLETSTETTPARELRLLVRGMLTAIELSFETTPLAKRSRHRLVGVLFHTSCGGVMRYEPRPKTES